MKIQHVPVALATILLAACGSSQPALKLTVELPSDTNIENSMAAAQIALDKAAAKLCGKSIKVPIESIIVSTDPETNPIGFKATSKVECDVSR